VLQAQLLTRTSVVVDDDLAAVVIDISAVIAKLDSTAEEIAFRPIDPYPQQIAPAR
jgi:hypothetical protein